MDVPRIQALGGGVPVEWPRKGIRGPLEDPMQRILGAIREGRCAIAVGGRAWKDPHFVAGLAERGGMPLMALGGEPGTDMPAASPDVVAAAAAR